MGTRGLWSRCSFREAQVRLLSRQVSQQAHRQARLAVQINGRP